jgi:MFS family permease
LLALFLIVGTMHYCMHATNIARPKIVAALDGMPLFAWSLSVPGLVCAFAALLFGKFSDVYGRKTLLFISVLFALIGTTLSSLSTNFVFLIAASAMTAVATGSSAPLAMSVLGDMFSPVERSKWIGLMNVPMGIAALLGPVAGGWLADNMGWRSVYWSMIPLLILCLIMAPLGLPTLAEHRARRKVDTSGCLVAAAASSTAIIGLSFAGDVYSWLSAPIIVLLGSSLVLWTIFLWVEKRAEDPIVDPDLLRNRTVKTIALAAMLASFGQIGMMVYFPMFLQGVLRVNGTTSGVILTPFTVLLAFIGIPVGFALARTRRYKHLYLMGFALITAQLFGILLISAETAPAWCLVPTTLGGMGLGALLTMNTIVIQNAVPKRLLGAAMGLFFFTLMLSVSISPAVLGSAMNAAYTKSLVLPNEPEITADTEISAAVRSPGALLSTAKLDELQRLFAKKGSRGHELFEGTVTAMQKAMLAGLRRVFLVAAIALLLGLLLVSTLPEVPLGSEATAKSDDLLHASPQLVEQGAYDNGQSA